MTRTDSRGGVQRFEVTDGESDQRFVIVNASNGLVT